MLYSIIKNLIKRGKSMDRSYPNSPGVYFFKDANNQIIYVGKAVSLRDRIRSYFQKTSSQDMMSAWKVKSLLQDYKTIDFIVTPTETEALLLEAELIREHQPKYNILLKDGQPFLYLMITEGELPEFKIVRNKTIKGRYFGPFIQKMQARKVHSFLEHTFQLQLCKTKITQGCLKYHLGSCAGNCRPDFDPRDYQFRVSLALAALTDDQVAFKKQIKEKIVDYNKLFLFEKAKYLHDYLINIEHIFRVLRIRFSEDKFADQIARVTAPKPIPSDMHTLEKELQDFLGIEKPFVTIDCFDISHFQSQSIVGSCVRFTNGVPDKKKFRHFKIKSLHEQNDYAALREIVLRRYKEGVDLPDLILIDGGKGQLNAVSYLYPQALFVSLAKREETLHAPTFPEGKKLDLHTGVGRLLIGLRDYAHHFAITYHRKRRKMSFKGAI